MRQLVGIKMSTVNTVFATLVTCLLLRTGLSAAAPTKTKFKAAVYEHAVILPEDREAVVSREEALRLMRKNLAIFAPQAEEAKRQGADIIVFPEDGIYGMLFTRQTVKPYLEFIPDPRNEQWIPCDVPNRYSDTEVQYELSCMAKTNKLYIVANIGDRQPCNSTSVPDCPDDGQFQYNTAVAYDPKGQLVARYHKRHLYYEYQFNTPPAEIVSFDTPFGRWGMFVCFDILFYEPAVTAVEREGISNIAFPTAWMDALPLLASIQFHSAFARRFGVNLLAANLHWPERRFQGSGIYTPRGMKAFYHNTTWSSEPKLLVAELDVMEKPDPETLNWTMAASEVTKLNDTETEASSPGLPGSAAHKETRVHATGEEQAYPPMSLRKATYNDSSVQTFPATMFRDNYTFVELVRPAGSFRVCNNRLCCQLNYSLTPNSENHDLFALGASDGLHISAKSYYLQVCALVRCGNRSRESCGRYTNQSATLFNSLSMKGTFETKYVYPEVLLTTAENQLRLARAEEWSFKSMRLESEEGFEYPLLTAALFGRDYFRDVPKNPEEHSRDTKDNGATVCIGNVPAIVSTLIALAIVMLQMATA